MRPAQACTAQLAAARQNANLGGSARPFPQQSVISGLFTPSSHQFSCSYFTSSETSAIIANLLKNWTTGSKLARSLTGHVVLHSSFPYETGL